MTTQFSIQTEDLKRFYRDRGKWGKPAKEPVKALDGVTLTVRPGELFGLLGPNGAGKTTLIKILTTLLLPTSGKAFVDGRDVVLHPVEVRRRINMVSGGEHAGYGILTVRETLWMFSQFYGVDFKTAGTRIDKLLALVGMKDSEKTKVYKLSTGMRQKMNFARGFINDPKVIFLDEPTLGLDVNAAIVCRNFMKEWMAERGDRTVLLTTHYMAEADELCDRIAIISRGRILACDTPAGLKRTVQKDVLFEVDAVLPDGSSDHLGGLPGVLSAKFTRSADSDVTRIRVAVTEDGVIARVLDQLTRDGGHIKLLQKTEPTLQDVFIKVVGRSFEEDESRPTP